MTLVQTRSNPHLAPNLTSALSPCAAPWSPDIDQTCDPQLQLPLSLEHQSSPYISGSFLHHALSAHPNPMIIKQAQTGSLALYQLAGERVWGLVIVVPEAEANTVVSGEAVNIH